MYQLNSLGLYMMSNQMVLFVDVLCLIMESSIIGQLDCKSVVDKSGVAFTYFSCKSSSIFLSYTISFEATTYFASIVESSRMDYLHDFQDIVVDPRLVRYPKVGTPFSLSPSNSESVCLTSLKFASTLEYLSPMS
jgi:hypothetical protein